MWGAPRGEYTLKDSSGEQEKEAQRKLDEVQLSYLAFQCFNKLVTSGYAVFFPPDQVVEIARLFWTAFWSGTLSAKMISWIKEIEEIATDKFLIRDTQLLTQVSEGSGR